MMRDASSLVSVAGARDATVSAAFFLVSALALGHALQINNGFYNRFAILWMTLALVCAGAGVISMRWRPGVSGRARAICRGLAAVGLLWQLLALLTSDPAMSMPPGTSLHLFRVGILLQALAVAAGVAGWAAARHVWFPALLGLTLVLGCWTVSATPAPRIDVVVAHREAFAALASGRNPYDMTYADIYGGAASGFYGQGAVVDGRVTTGSAYMPLTLLLAAPGQWVFGDYRYAEVVAFVLGAALIAAAGGSRDAKIAAAILVTTPRLYFVFDQGWNEPMVVLLLGLAISALARAGRLAALGCGLLVAAKQYVVLGLVAIGRALVARGEKRARRIWIAGAVAVATALPFFLWSPSAFYKALVLLQFREPFRPDSMSYLSLANRLGLGDPSRIWTVLAAVAGVTLTAVCTPRSAAGVAATLAFATFATFAFGSKAFCNYYFFVIAALVAAVAATPAERDRDA